MAVDTHPDIHFLRFDSVIGCGGMSTVWRAWHRELERFVAVKVLNPAFGANGTDVRQFMAEVRTMTLLDHPGIVRGYGADFKDGRYFFIMDYVDGYTFGSLLRRKGHISQNDAIIICESVANAMDYAWNSFNLVHCDIKPDNIMTDSKGTVKLMDLGICRSTAAIRGSDMADEIVGTPAYISPEQIYGDMELDCRADIYSLGASLYHLVTGRTLFPRSNNDDILRAHVDTDEQAPDPSRFRETIDDNFARLLAGMLVKDRDWRYANWHDLYEAVTILDNGGEIPPLPQEAVSSICLNE